MVTSICNFGIAFIFGVDMVIMNFSETLVATYKATQRCNLEDQKKLLIRFYVACNVLQWRLTWPCLAQVTAGFCPPGLESPTEHHASSKARL